MKFINHWIQYKQFFFIPMLLLFFLIAGCSTESTYKAGEVIGVPQTMTQGANEGYVDKTTGANQQGNPYNR